MLILVLLVLALVQADSNLGTYSGAVVGDVVYIGRIHVLFGNQKSYSARDCQATFYDDKATGGATLEVLDVDPNEQVGKDAVRSKTTPYLLARTGSTSGSFGYELKCGDDKGTGVLRVSTADAFSLGDLRSLRIELGNDTAANRTEYLVLKGIDGNNLTASMESSDSYFNDFLGKLRDLTFYTRNDDDSLSAVNPANFDKILPLRELAVDGRPGLIDVKDITSQLAVVENDGSTVSYYELESDKKLGLIYVFTGKKDMNPPKGKTLTHCFPTLRKGVVINYYCLFEDVDAKKPGAMVYYDLASTNENLEARNFDGVKTILASKPILSEDRTCLLAVGNDGKKRIMCLDATKGLEKTADNQKTYFMGKTVKINHGEDCFLQAEDLDADDFRFDSAPVFTCQSGSKVTASFTLDNTYEAAEPGVSKVKTVMPIASGNTVLCVDDDEIIYTENKNTTIVIQGGMNRPGQLLKYPLGVAGVTDFAKIHCARDNVIILVDTKKKPYILDIKRGTRGESTTRVNSLIDLPDLQNKIKVATGSSAILYNVNKKGAVADVVEYNSFLGLLKIVNKDYTNAESHSARVVIRSGKNIQKLNVTTELVNDKSLEVTKIKSMSGLKPGNSYPIRDYLNVKGQIWSLDYKPTVHSVYMFPDQVSFENSYNSSSAGSRFALDGYFVDTKDKTYSKNSGDSKKLSEDVLTPSRILGTFNLDKEVVIIGKRDGNIGYIQGWYIDSNGGVKGTDIVKLDGTFGSNSFYDSPIIVKSGNKQLIAFNKDGGKATGVEYKYVPEDKSIVFLSGSQSEVDWHSADSANGYRISTVDEHSGSRLVSCAHLKVEGNDLKNPQLYSICDITGGSSDRVYIRNFHRCSEGNTVFDLFNHPSAESGVNSVTWWTITSNLIGTDGKLVSPDAFTYKATLNKRFSSLGNHTVRSVSKISDKAYAVVSEIPDGDGKGLWESYYGSEGYAPYFQRRFSDERTSWSDYDLHYAVSDPSSSKRIYTNYAKDFTNVADIVFREAYVKLSNHTASVHVKNPFTLDFNKGQHIEKGFFLDLDKFYADDGKTDRDDEKPKPVPEPDVDPLDPTKKPRKSRLWVILGILLLIILIGAGDLYLRRRSAMEEAESEMDKDKPKVVKKKVGGRADGEEHLTGSINEL